jgi:hypothetical protein
MSFIKSLSGTRKFPKCLELVFVRVTVGSTGKSRNRANENSLPLSF